MTAAQQFKLDPHQKTVFLLGGSQGSLLLNQTVQSIVDRLADTQIQLLWQTGRQSHTAYERFDSDRIRVVPFITDMAQAYALADLVISRAGALALAEITACGKPAILIPLASAAGDHQTRNAAALVRAGAALMIRETELTGEILLDRITSLLEDATVLKHMGEKAAELSRPEATTTIVDQILELARA
jgi:UDP-N-acetylglucosamine--N-acetylmuramyl-(pentapeptide) pyrophosphoryl-undecaprenol N-acetylglucosamine transferase